jgi:hypothetical protein
MTGLRITSLLFLFWPAACTEPNPGYTPSDGDVTSCTPGQRVCSGDNLMVCVPRPEPPHLELERACPAPSRCEEGFCAPAGEQCVAFCEHGQVCTVFAIPGVGRLGTYCAEPVGTKAGGVPCARPEECQSGFCVSGGKVPVCFRGCNRSRDCGIQALRCVDVKLTVNGVSGTLAACVP